MKKNGKKPSPPFLRQISGEGEGRTFELSRESLSMGRGPDNEILLGGTSVSRCHARIQKADKGWMLIDNKSRNGIFLNGKKITSAKIKIGDTFKVGIFEFRFCSEDSPLSSTLSPVIEAKFKPPSLPPSFNKPKQERRPPPPSKIDSDQWSVFFGIVGGIFIGFLIWTKQKVQPLDIRTVSSAPVSTQAPVDVPVLPTPEQKEAEEKRMQKILNLGKQDVPLYLKEGRDYLRDSSWDAAAIAFRVALAIDPNNQEAVDGLSAAETKKRIIPRAAKTAQSSKLTKRDLKTENKKIVSDLLKAATESLKNRRYQDSIQTAEKARKINIPTEKAYLNEAKQIIDRARAKQKEEFEPFLQNARSLMEKGEYKEVVSLCSEMLKVDPGYSEASLCLKEANEKMSLKGVK
jgi:tetratricopeptide (TPR) repeat protein